MKKKHLANSGFTIVELIITVSILAIGSSLFVVSRNRELKREKINAAVVGLVGWIEETRRAALNGAQCNVIIKAGTYSYSSSPNLDIIATSEPVATSLSQVTNCQPSGTGYKLPSKLGTSKIKINTGADLSFTTLGTLYNSTANYAPREIVLTLVSPAGNDELSRCIRVSGIMGLIEIGNRNSGSCNYEARF